VELLRHAVDNTEEEEDAGALGNPDHSQSAFGLIADVIAALIRQQEMLAP
jgi:hypothetical protein